MQPIKKLIIFVLQESQQRVIQNSIFNHYYYETKTFRFRDIRY